MKKKIISVLLMLGLVIFVAAPISVLAGTASASADSGDNGGQTCGKISKKRDSPNTGAMTVGTVSLNGTPMTLGVDYKIRAGTDNSTRPVIEFTNPLPKNAKVDVTLGTLLGGTFKVVLELTHCKK